MEFTEQTYRDLVHAYRAKVREEHPGHSSGQGCPAYLEACVAGWLPAPTDRLQQTVRHPLLGLEVPVERVLAEHARIMGEGVQTWGCHPCWVHPAAA